MEVFNTIAPHLVALGLYVMALVYSIVNFGYLARVQSKLPIWHALVWLSLMIVTVCGLFVGIQGYWLVNNGVTDQSGLFVMLWTSFHYYNALTYILMSAGINIYSRWRTKEGNENSYVKRREDDWL